VLLRNFVLQADQPPSLGPQAWWLEPDGTAISSGSLLSAASLLRHCLFVSDTFCPPSMCLIPGFDGALFTVSWKEALWARYSMGAPRRLRQSVERYSIVAGQASQHQPEDRRQVEAAHLDSRSADRTKSSQINRAIDRGRGDDRRLPTPYAAAAGRLPVRVAGDDPAPDALVAAPLSSAPRHITAAHD